MGLLPKNARGAVAGLLLLAALAATVAACGGSDGEGGAGVGSVHDLSAEEQAEFETERRSSPSCLREHGIEGLPDPQVSGNGFMFVGVPLAPRPPEGWDAAQEACQPVFDAAAPPDETADAAGWERIVPGGDCRCSDGSEFSFWVREANPEKIVFFLAGRRRLLLRRDVRTRATTSTTPRRRGPGGGGIFDFADARNPFADYSVVYVPYCTGDVHIGNLTTEYAPGLTVHHNGYVNGTAALDHLAAAFPDATDVVVIGESAGSIAAPLYAGLVSDRLPDAGITVLADGSGSYPDVRRLQPTSSPPGGPATPSRPGPRTPA